MVLRCARDTMPTMTANQMFDADRSAPAAVIYAATRDGYTLPVIDITNPRFAVPDDPESLRQLFAASVDEELRRRRIPRFIMQWMLKSAARRSRLVRAVFNGDATFLDGITTYVMKLGADNLPPPYDSPVDKRMAASPHLTLLRLRTQQVARLLADGLGTELASAPHSPSLSSPGRAVGASPGDPDKEGNALLSRMAGTSPAMTRPLHLINIAGGPAIDSMNTLIVLNRRGGALLRRPIVIHVLDPDDAGPYFGRNALAALMKDGGPLNGLDIAFDHRSYDWDRPASLEALLRELSAANAIIAASTEGGLFEYGSDAAIVANLTALRAAGVKLVAGSVTSADESRRRMITATRFKLVPRGLEGFAPLADRGGYRVARAETAQLSEQVLLEAA
jgi:hypothetical protein